MNIPDLSAHYHALRSKLEAAYAAPVWISQDIDAIAEQLISLERVLISSSAFGADAALPSRLSVSDS